MEGLVDVNCSKALHYTKRQAKTNNIHATINLNLTIMFITVIYFIT